METRLKESLWEGEEIRWSGRPKPFQLMDKTMKNSIILTWIVSACVLAAILIFLIPGLMSGARSTSDAIILLVITLFLPGILSARPFMDKKCLEERTLYAITNFRIIAVVKDEVMYLPIGKGMKVALEQQEDGCGNVRFGELVGKPASKSRAHAVLGLRADDDKNDMCGLLFYHVDQPDKVMSYLA
ncbi:MAG: hypothetical protein ACOX7N_04155 [Lawsonibacter sp.]|jgi:hypothetical protein